MEKDGVWLWTDSLGLILLHVKPSVSVCVTDPNKDTGQQLVTVNVDVLKEVAGERKLYNKNVVEPNVAEVVMHLQEELAKLVLVQVLLVEAVYVPNQIKYAVSLTGTNVFQELNVQMFAKLFEDTRGTHNDKSPQKNQSSSLAQLYNYQVERGLFLNSRYHN